MLVDTRRRFSLTLSRTDIIHKCLEIVCHHFTVGDVFKKTNFPFCPDLSFLQANWSAQVHCHQSDHQLVDTRVLTDNHSQSHHDPHSFTLWHGALCYVLPQGTVWLHYPTDASWAVLHPIHWECTQHWLQCPSPLYVRTGQEVRQHLQHQVGITTCRHPQQLWGDQGGVQRLGHFSQTEHLLHGCLSRR